MQKSISFQVVNTQLLESGLATTHKFDETGGVIGSSVSADWVLNDSEYNIKPQHCQLLRIDGEFCLMELAGPVYINGATLPIGFEKKVKLKDNDALILGLYHVRVNFGLAGGKQRQASQALEDLFPKTDTDVDLLSDDLFEPIVTASAAVLKDDPLEALDALQSSKVDSLDLLQDELQITSTETADYLLGNDQHWQGQDFIVQADSEFDTDSAIALKQKPSMDNFIMDEKTLDLLESELSSEVGTSWNEELDTGMNHLAVGPLFRGLGVQVGNKNDSNQMQAVAMEMGSSLQAAIKGLLSLHQSVNNSRYAHINKNLQPIEDNPLRLGLGYEDTMKTLFDSQSCAVHLSSQAAIAESLQTIELHNEAVQTAITESLGHILEAFSPEGLMKRFKKYRRASDVQTHSTEHWAWNMYESYYQELTSNRQQGFEKLFWEIFDQAYDKKLRELQRLA
ncbi:type VI secretion system-associated FHA domain protein TagH [Shewanella surugensis]|uniref:Type VI secretion system-associated FHA domain protein TagH n=1 Tax=Shewanella surugensis TaxID=212020 RepID=A0ABT0LDY8_9GAMM|nr:type VI secretion system-associated FHA domain protein TagH [Shewanella surugensis]MCL1125545.1 type VI secretion system-associated FHA domain protein TagH [Shewanella surugensis]